MRSSAVPFSTAGRPQISAAPVYSQDLLARQMNMARAQGEAQLGGRVANMQGEMTARGFGSQSPLMAALEAMYGSQNRRALDEQELGLYTKASEANAAHILEAQRAQEGQYASAQQAALQQQGFESAEIQAQNQLIASLYASLSGLM